MKAAAAASSPTYTSDAITSSSADRVCADDSVGTSLRGIKQEVRERLQDGTPCDTNPDLQLMRVTRRHESIGGAEDQRSLRAEPAFNKQTDKQTRQLDLILNREASTDVVLFYFLLEQRHFRRIPLAQESNNKKKPHKVKVSSEAKESTAELIEELREAIDLYFHL